MPAKPKPKPVRPAAIPLRTFMPYLLPNDQVKQILRGTGSTLLVQAFIQVLEGQIGELVMDMANEVPGAAPAFRRVKEFYDGVLDMVDDAPEGAK